MNLPKQAITSLVKASLFAVLFVSFPLRAGVVCNWNKDPLFEVTELQYPAAIAPCDKAQFSVTVESRITDQDIRIGDWDTCEKTGQLDEYHIDNSLHFELIASEGTIDNEALTWTPPPIGPFPKTYQVKVKVYNDPSHAEFRADRNDGVFEIPRYITVSWEPQTVMITEPACQGATLVTAAKYVYSSHEYNNNGTPETHIAAAVPLKAQAVPDCATDSATWTAAGAPTGQVQRWFNYAAPGLFEETASPVGRDVLLWYDGTPVDNNGFGKRWARVLSNGQTDPHDVHNFYLYFNPLGTMHPRMTGEPATPPSARWPDWYYYWSKTSANQGQPAHKFSWTVPPSISGNTNSKWGYTTFWNDFTYPNSPLGSIYIGPSVYLHDYTGDLDTPYANKLWSGLDLFAVVIRHEAQHSINYRTWWEYGYSRWAPEPGLYYLFPQQAVKDYDGDRIPGLVEEQISDDLELSTYLQSMNLGQFNGKVLHWQLRDTDNDGFADEEEYTMAMHQLDPESSGYWQSHSSDGEDWSVNGVQWTTSTCPIQERG